MLVHFCMIFVRDTVLSISAWSRAHCEDIVNYCMYTSSANLGGQQGVSLSSSLSSPLQDADAGRVEVDVENEERDRRSRPSSASQQGFSLPYQHHQSCPLHGDDSQEDTLRAVLA